MKTLSHQYDVCTRMTERYTEMRKNCKGGQCINELIFLQNAYIYVWMSSISTPRLSSQFTTYNGDPNAWPTGCTTRSRRAALWITGPVSSQRWVFTESSHCRAVSWLVSKIRKVDDWMINCGLRGWWVKYGKCQPTAGILQINDIDRYHCDVIYWHFQLGNVLLRAWRQSII